MNTAEKIRQLRESRGLLQSDLAVIIGVSDKAISSWENGTRLPRMGAIEKLAAYFQVPKGYFFDDDAQSVPAPLDDGAMGKHVSQLKARPELCELLRLGEVSSKTEVLQMIRIIRAMKGE